MMNWANYKIGFNIINIITTIGFDGLLLQPSSILCWPLKYH